jgi:hypothetical protein
VYWKPMAASALAVIAAVACMEGVLLLRTPLQTESATITRAKNLLPVDWGATLCGTRLTITTAAGHTGHHCVGTNAQHLAVGLNVQVTFRQHPWSEQVIVSTVTRHHTEGEI